MLDRIRLLSVFGPFRRPARRNDTRVRLSVEHLDPRIVPAATLVSVSAAGTDAGNERSQVVADVSQTSRGAFRAVSADGRYVLFQSFAKDLQPGGDLGFLYVRDRVAAATSIVSVLPNGKASDAGDSSISADGRVVVFTASDGRLYARNLQTQSTAQVTVRADGLPATGGAGPGGYGATVSDDGRFIAFNYLSNDLVPGDTNGTNDIFVRDLTSGTTTLVSHTTAGGVGGGESVEAAISGNGKTVVFRSKAADLSATPDANNAFDLFAYSVADGKVAAISTNLAGTATGDKGVAPQYRVDGTGTKVVFKSPSTNLTAVPGVADAQVFARDLTAGRTALLSLRPDGRPLAGDVGPPAISDDGKFVTFVANSSLAAVTSPNDPQVYLVELATSRVSLASRTPSGVGAGGISGFPVLSGDGRYVVFTSDSADLVPGVALEANGGGSRQTLFAYDRVANATVALSTNAAGNQTLSTGASTANTRFSVSRDGSVVVFTTDQTGYGPVDTNKTLDVYATAVPAAAPLVPAAFTVGGADGGVRLVSAAGATIGTPFRPFDVAGSSYKGLVQVAVGDVSGDGVADVFVSAASPAGGAGLDASKAGKVFVYDGAALAAGRAPTSPIRVFVPFATTDGPGGTTGAYVNGLNVAVADVDGDGKPDVIAGTRGGTGGAGGGNREYGRVAVVSGAGTGNTLIGAVVKPFGNGYEKGVVLAAGSLDGDTKAEIAVTRGGPVASTNPNGSVKLKAYRLVGSALAELNLSGGSSVFAPFEAVTAGDGGAITRDARVAFADPDGDGKALLLFTALDRGADLSGNKVRVGAFAVDAASGKATLVSTGAGSTPATYVVGSAVADHAISRAAATGKGTNLALVTESGSSGVLFLDPLTGAAVPGGFALGVAAGGVSIAGL